MLLETVCAQLMNGLVLGMILALISMGLSLVFGLMNVVNFAHGLFYALGAYCAYFIIVTCNSNFWVAALLVPVIIGLLGAVVELGLFKKIYDLPHYFQIFLSFGLTLCLTELIRIIWGTIGKPVSVPSELNFIIHLGLFSYPFYRIFVLIFTMLLAIGVWSFLQKTELGLLIRAGIDDREMVEGLGIDISKVYTLTFSLGTAIAGLSGVLAAPIILVYPEMGPDVIIKAFVVVIVGGLGSFRGPILASLMLMTISTMTVLVWAPLSDIVIFIAMAVFLMIKPTGLFGERY
ncbi:MAG: branched-chain amino acid ABC transporter permease [Candidatus Bathyarchaeia archaeon]